MRSIRKLAFVDLAEFYPGEASECSTGADVGCCRPAASSRCVEAEERGYQRGLLEGLKRAGDDGARQLAEQKNQFDECLATEKQILLSRYADNLVAQLDQGLRLISSHIEERVASLLKPRLMHQECERVLSELVASIQRATSDAARIHIQGPEPLLKRLKEQLTVRDVTVVFAQSEDANLILTADDTIIEFNLAIWHSSLEDSMR